jgi:hypothetical protein
MPLVDLPALMWRQWMVTAYKSMMNGDAEDTITPSCSLNIKAFCETIGSFLKRLSAFYE